MEPPKTTKTTDPAAKRRNRTSARRATLSPSPKSTVKAPTDESLARQAALGLITSATSARALIPGGPPVLPSLVSELNNIDFGNMIGGPLQAAIDAQVASSLATVNFINAVGFKAPATSGGAPELIMVDFSHVRKEVDAEGKPLPNKDVFIRVPLLAILPIPCLRIEHVIIDFNVKLNSVETSSVSTDLGISGSVGGGGKRVNFKVSASYQRKATSGVEVKKEYALNVNVKAVQDEIPAGLEKVLNMLAA
jgi:hypothetical protein